MTEQLKRTNDQQIDVYNVLHETNIELAQLRDELTILRKENRKLKHQNSLLLKGVKNIDLTSQSSTSERQFELQPQQLCQSQNAQKSHDFETEHTMDKIAGPVEVDKLDKSHSKDVSIASYIAVNPVYDAGKEIAVEETNIKIMHLQFTDEVDEALIEEKLSSVYADIIGVTNTSNLKGNYFKEHLQKEGYNLTWLN